jgi:hypothetical protein
VAGAGVRELRDRLGRGPKIVGSFGLPTPTTEPYGLDPYSRDIIRIDLQESPSYRYRSGFCCQKVALVSSAHAEHGASEDPPGDLVAIEARRGAEAKPALLQVLDS